MKAIAMGLLLCCAMPAQAACLGATPLAAARAWFERHYEFFNDDPAPTRDLYTAELYRLLQREYDCTAQGELCALGADPWLDAQDGEARDPQYTAIGERAVRVSYRFLLAPSEPAQMRSATLQFSGASGCWRADDLVGPAGLSFKRTLQDAYPP
ncbi:hypothetical protein [Lysobacter silvisoli]|uniref:DUF3828 domain-containing protein n=1 Tax=Lysobacter silvisoli TaxID=2293254 RepID=A0A371K3Z8_9GAMM|nr:hypothetical protein [Lysobacter silvisoli]RDZ28645.1 hypothetical protein DX914_05835 [Lysobacter silvisoli]